MYLVSTEHGWRSSFQEESCCYPHKLPLLLLLHKFWSSGTAADIEVYISFHVEKLLMIFLLSALGSCFGRRSYECEHLSLMWSEGTSWLIGSNLSSHQKDYEFHDPLPALSIWPSYRRRWVNILMLGKKWPQKIGQHLLSDKAPQIALYAWILISKRRMCHAKLSSMLRNFSGVGMRGGGRTVAVMMFLISSEELSCELHIRLQDCMRHIHFDRAEMM